MSSSSGKPKGVSRLHPWGAAWLASLRVSPNTVKDHAGRLDRLLQYIVQLGGSPAPDLDLSRLLDIEYQGVHMGKGPVDTAFLNDFLTWHEGEVLSPDARGRKRNEMIGTLHLFFGWCLRCAHLGQDPSRYLETASVRRKINHRKHLTPSESQALLLAAATSGQNALRNVALVSPLLLAGLRPSELCRLVPADLNWESGWMLADGKTGQGAAPMPPALAKVLRDYLASPYYQARRFPSACCRLVSDQIQSA